MNNLENHRKTMQKTSNNLENHRQRLGKNELCGAFSRAKERKTLGPWSLACPGLCTCGAAGPPGIPLASSAAPRASGSWSPWKHLCPVQPRKLRRLVHACNTFTNPHNHFVLAALRLENAISFLLCVLHSGV